MPPSPGSLFLGCHLLTRIWARFHSPPVQPAWPIKRWAFQAPGLFGDPRRIGGGGGLWCNQRQGLQSQLRDLSAVHPPRSTLPPPVARVPKPHRAKAPGKMALLKGRFSLVQKEVLEWQTIRGREINEGWGKGCPHHRQGEGRACGIGALRCVCVCVCYGHQPPHTPQTKTASIVPHLLAYITHFIPVY